MKSTRVVALLAVVTCVAALGGCSTSGTPTDASYALDTTAPPAPDGLSLTTDAATQRQSLSWNPSPAPDVASYQVYEYDPDPLRDAAYVIVSETRASALDFNYRSDPKDTFFRVRAVDQAGNRSAFSQSYGVHLIGVGEGGSGSTSERNRDPRKRIEE